MTHPPDEASSHKYEVKRVHMDGGTFNAVVFYLRVGEPVDIKLEEVLKKTHLWAAPTEAEPKREYHLIFEVEPEDDKMPIELYISRFGVELEAAS